MFRVPFVKEMSDKCLRIKSWVVAVVEANLDREESAQKT